jgi:hypothetical protein
VSLWLRPSKNGNDIFYFHDEQSIISFEVDWYAPHNSELNAHNSNAASEKTTAFKTPP